MPLSKKRTRERKRQDRLLVGFDKRLLVPQRIKPVKPNEPEIDADGNIIPED